MYIYVNENGRIVETVNDVALRQANDNINHIYLYCEDLPIASVAQMWATFKLPDGSLTPETPFSVVKVTKQIPYSAKRDLKFFVDYEEYDFYDITLPTEVISSTGLILATIRFSDAGGTTLYALNTISFYVEDSVVIKDSYITLSQYNELLEKFSAVAGSAVWGYISGTLANQTDLITYITNAIAVETTRATTIEATKQDDMKLSIVDGKINITWEE